MPAKLGQESVETVPKTICMPKPLLEKIKAEAKERGVNVSEMARIIITKWYEEPTTVEARLTALEQRMVVMENTYKLSRI